MNTQKKENTDELKSTNGYAENTDNRLHYSENNEAWKINDTPYTVAREGQQWMLLIGRFLIKGGLSSRAEAEIEADVIDATRIMQLAEITYKLVDEMNELRNIVVNDAKEVGKA